MTISAKDDVGKSDKGKGNQLQKKTDGASRDRKRSRCPTQSDRLESPQPGAVG